MIWLKKKGFVELFVLRVTTIHQFFGCVKTISSDYKDSLCYLAEFLATDTDIKVDPIQKESTIKLFNIAMNKMAKPNTKKQLVS